MGEKMKLSKKEMEETKKDEKELKELNNWLQRLQQNVESLEKRLDAIERRLSGEPFEKPTLSTATKNEIENELKRLKEEINKLKKNTEKPVLSISRKTEKTGKNYDALLMDIERRIEKLEKRKGTPVVKVGKVELPIEITGIVGGLLAFMIAIMIFEGYKKLVVSPAFVAFIGIVLLIATGIKTYIINAKK